MTLHRHMISSRLVTAMLVLLSGPAWGQVMMQYHEAPMLTEMVKAGTLPPLNDRLPDQPLVVKPVAEIGRYGGTLTTFAVGNSASNDLTEHVDVGNTTLLRFTNDGSIFGGLARAYELSDDAKSCTVYLRKGAKWSDGQPFTADDIVFMFEDMHWNDKISTWFFFGGVSRVRKLDDYTVRFEMDEPFPSIEIKMANWMGGGWGIFQPQHYLQKWHINHNTKADELAKEEGFDNWWEAFQFHYAFSPVTSDIDKPTMRPWMFKQYTTTVKEFERNPYFYQVDQEGNQLPYIDRIVSTIVDAEVYQLKIVSGEADVAVWFVSVANYALYKENEEANGYRVYELPGVVASEAAFGINQNHPDPFLRGIFQDVRFRRALSLAIDREDINETVFYGLGVPAQATALPSTRFYKEEWAETYAQYDPDAADELLDEVGITERDSDGFRVGPDGKPILILVEYPEWAGEVMGDIFELVKEYWEDVGLKVALKVLAGAQFGQRSRALDHVIMSHPYADTGEIGDYVWSGRAAVGSGGLSWSPAWKSWLDANEAVRTGRKTLEDFEGGTLPGEEPPEEIKELDYLSLEKQRTKFGSRKYVEIMQKMYDFHAERLYVVGTVGMVPTLYIAKTGIGNVPTAYPYDKAFQGDLFNEAQQLFWKE